jgi:hypothetical protein
MILGKMKKFVSSFMNQQLETNLNLLPQIQGGGAV